MKARGGEEEVDDAGRLVQLEKSKAEEYEALKLQFNTMSKDGQCSSEEVRMFQDHLSTARMQKYRISRRISKVLKEVEDPLGSNPYFAMYTRYYHAWRSAHDRHGNTVQSKENIAQLEDTMKRLKTLNPPEFARLEQQLDLEYMQAQALQAEEVESGDENDI